MLDFRLYTFLTLSETLNYTKAADILCITQPAVSQHIKYMEKEYDCKLFFYDGKQLNLTAQGKLLAEKVRTMVADEKMIRSLLKQNQKTPALRFGATLTIGEFILPQRLNSFLAEHKETSLCMIVENTATLLQMLNSGDIGFAFVEGYFPKQTYDWKLLSQERYVAVKGKHYTLQKEVRCLKDLVQEKLMVREDGSGTREILERGMQEINLSIASFQRVIEIGNVQAIKTLVRNNQGISFLYEAAAREEIEKGELEVIDLYDFHILHEFNYITLKDSVFKEQYDAFFASVCRP